MVMNAKTFLTLACIVLEHTLKYLTSLKWSMLTASQVSVFIRILYGPLLAFLVSKLGCFFQRIKCTGFSQWICIAIFHYQHSVKFLKFSPAKNDGSAYPGYKLVHLVAQEFI